MKKLILLSASFMLVNQVSRAQALNSVTGLRFYEHHSSTINGGADFGSGVNPSQSGYDFVKRAYYPSVKMGGAYTAAELENIDMVEHNGYFGGTPNFGFTSGVSTIWGGSIKGNNTTLWMEAPVGFNFTTITKVSDISSVFITTTATKAIAAVKEGGIYLAQIRGTKLYVAMRCYNVKNATSSGGKKDVYFDFDYKYGILSSTSIAELNQGQKVSVYPNPATNHLTIQNTSGMNINVKLVSLYGQDLFSFPLAKSMSKDLDISNLSIGIYWLVCQSEGGLITTEKIIKN